MQSSVAHCFHGVVLYISKMCLKQMRTSSENRTQFYKQTHFNESKMFPLLYWQLLPWLEVITMRIHHRVIFSQRATTPLKYLLWFAICSVWLNLNRWKPNLPSNHCHRSMMWNICLWLLLLITCIYLWLALHFYFKDVEFTVARLVSGLAASRARLGFATSLTQLLRMFPTITVGKLLSLIEENLGISPGEAKRVLWFIKFDKIWFNICTQLLMSPKSLWELQLLLRFSILKFTDF